MNMYDVLSSLSIKSPVFRSQKEFQRLLINELKTRGLHCMPDKNINKNTKVDIWVEDPKSGEIWIFELRNKTKEISTSLNGKQVELKNHGAQDQGRYDFLKDIEKIEKAVSTRDNVTGFGIIITNDPYYWEQPTKHDSVDRDFHINEGRIVSGILRWDPLASQGTKKTVKNRYS